MPELAEVAFFQKQWMPARGMVIRRVCVRREARDFRECDVDALEAGLTGAVFRGGKCHGKQMLFEFDAGYAGRKAFMGIHLGMAGRLGTGSADLVPDGHQHLVIYTDQAALWFTDYRQFGKVLFAADKGSAPWWRNLPPEILSLGFTRERVKGFFLRRAKSPVKAVLLMQECFPGVGNWMADEILWRARIHPATAAGEIRRQRMTRVWEKTIEVAEDALKVIGEDYSDPPNSWLFPHRWKAGGRCPRTGTQLVRETIGGRTTCFSPQWQR